MPHTSSQTSWQSFLNDVKALLQQEGKTSLKIFISYAWEETDEATQQLQKRLTRLRDDLTTLGCEVFLDISEMTGHIQETMLTRLKAANIVLPIYTQRYATRIAESQTNVAIEYQATLEKFQADPNSVLPLQFN